MSEMKDNGPRIVCAGCGNPTGIFKPICDDCMAMAGCVTKTGGMLAVLDEELERQRIAVAAGHADADAMDEFQEARDSAAELLEALEMVIADKAPVYHDCTDDGLPECAWCIARSAIAKANSLG